MKHCKHYFAFLLAGALLLLPVTSHYAYNFSWEEIKKRARTFVSEDTVRKTMPGAVVALGIGGVLYYWWMKRGGITEPVTALIEGRLVTQFPVYSQFWWYGEGAASSGYHALLRGMQIVEAKRMYNSDKSLQEILKMSDPIADDFGTNGNWRQFVIQRRQSDDRNGDWLGSDELEFLWNKKIMMRPDVCGFTAIDDFYWITPNIQHSYEQPKELKEDEIPLHKMIRVIQEKLQTKAIRKTPYFHVFAMGDPYNQPEKHWFALVLYQDDDGDRKYFIADSKNLLRIHDERVENLINAIEEIVVEQEI
jgi:hypothetical protein